VTVHEGQTRLPAPALGTPRLHLRRVDSTNERARVLARRGAPHGTVVTAEEQTAGRGRQGRSWVAPPASALLCSLIVRDPPPLLPLAAGVAVAECADTLRPAGGPPACLKWPNDVLIEGRKVAGILVEARPQERWAVLGIGLNVAVDLDQLAPELRPRAATLGLDPPAVEDALRELLARLARWLSPQAQHRLTGAFAARDALRGRWVGWSAGILTGGGRAPARGGLAEGIDAAGRLVVRLDDGTRVALDSGEVHLREPPSQAS
jgi:BirA family biotin operon repressor/biotin-[acetyl-CoA-carboxylase] ligase